MKENLHALYPGIFVHNVFLDEQRAKDRRAGFWGDCNEQIAIVAEQLAGIEELGNGFDAVGFSQGGQFMRWVVRPTTSESIR